MRESGSDIDKEEEKKNKTTDKSEKEDEGT